MFFKKIRSNIFLCCTVLFFIHFHAQAHEENSLPQTITFQKDSVQIDSILISGNKITKDYIIQKELLFRPHQKYEAGTLKTLIIRSEQNLTNTLLFLTETITDSLTPDKKLFILVQVKERWYIFPAPRFNLADRNFNVWWVEYNHDFDRTNYGVEFEDYNLTGRNDKLDFVFIGGFTQKFEINYNIPYINKNKDYGAGGFISYSRNHELNYTTFNNRQVFYEDTAYAIKQIKTGAKIIRRYNTYYYHTLELKYNYNEISQTIADLNPYYFLNGKTTQQFLSLIYTLEDNHYDDKAYPLAGHFSRIRIRKTGLGFFEDVNQFSISGQYNYYKPLQSKLFYGGEILGKINIGTQYPYNLLESLGYCEAFVRGYEYYVIDGERIFLMRNNLKHQLFKWRFNAPLVDWQQFERIPLTGYVKIFADAGYVYDTKYTNSNFLTNRFMYSGGIGLDVTSYYNWVFRLEYAVNALGEFGLYLHLNLDLNTYEDCNLW